LVSDGFVKALASLLTFIAFIAPIVYGLGEYDWNLSSMIKPSFQIPEIGIDARFKSLKYADSKLILILQVDNSGEVDLEIISFEGKVYAFKDIELGRLNLAEEISLPAGSSRKIALHLNPRAEALTEIYSKILREQYEKADLFIEGEMRIRVFGIITEIPVSERFEISLQDLGVGV